MDRTAGGDRGIRTMFQWLYPDPPTNRSPQLHSWKVCREHCDVPKGMASCQLVEPVGECHNVKTSAGKGAIRCDFRFRFEGTAASLPAALRPVQYWRLSLISLSKSR